MGNVDINDIQLWLARGLRVLPIIDKIMAMQLVRLALQQKVCILPQYRLQMYSDGFKKAN